MSDEDIHIVLRVALAVVLIAAMLAYIAYLNPARSEEEIHHHAGESAEVDQFYSTWMRPDNRSLSCCNKVDCYATQVKNYGGTWFARHRETGDFIPVADTKIEYDRDSPDGRSHMCATPFKIVYCLKIGGGT